MIGKSWLITRFKKFASIMPRGTLYEARKIVRTTVFDTAIENFSETRRRTSEMKVRGGKKKSSTRDHQVSGASTSFVFGQMVLIAIWPSTWPDFAVSVPARVSTQKSSRRGNCTDCNQEGSVNFPNRSTAILCSVSRVTCFRKARLLRGRQGTDATFTFWHWKSKRVHESATKWLA